MEKLFDCFHVTDFSEQKILPVLFLNGTFYWPVTSFLEVGFNTSRRVFGMIFKHELVRRVNVSLRSVQKCSFLLACVKRHMAHDTCLTCVLVVNYR